MTSHDIPSVAVPMTVAARERVDPTDLPLLHDVVDPDALDRLLSGDAVDSVTFTYHGYRVTVHGDGTVALRD